MKRFAPMIGTISLLLLTLGVMPAQAQQIEPPSQSEIQTYAEAAVAVQEVADQYRTEAENAESQAELDQLQSSYSEALGQAVEDEGMSIERYNQIFELVQRNPELAQTVNDEIMDLQN